MFKNYFVNEFYNKFVEFQNQFFQNTPCDKIVFNYLKVIDSAKLINSIIIKYDTKLKFITAKYVDPTTDELVSKYRKVKDGDCLSDSCAYAECLSLILSDIPYIRLCLLKFSWGETKKNEHIFYDKNIPFLPCLQSNLCDTISFMEYIHYRKYRLGKDTILFNYNK